jgi:hypothetical protein
MKLGERFQTIKLFPDFQRLFTHGRGATTLSFYLQGNVTFGDNCPASICNTGGQVCNPGSWNVTETCAHCYCHTGADQPGFPSPGAARVVLGVFDTSDDSSDAVKLEAVAVGMFPAWSRNRSAAQPYTYGTRTTGQHKFANVQLLNQTT